MTFWKSLQISSRYHLPVYIKTIKTDWNDSLANFMKSFVSEKIKVHFVKSQKKVID